MREREREILGCLRGFRQKGLVSEWQYEFVEFVVLYVLINQSCE